jgi:hypothetical protein
VFRLQQVGVPAPVLAPLQHGLRRLQVVLLVLGPRLQLAVSELVG